MRWPRSSTQARCASGRLPTGSALRMRRRRGSSDWLERLALVERAADPSDRRATQVRSTQDGERLLRLRRRQLVELLSGPLSDVPDEQRDRFVRLLADLNAVLAGAPDEPRRARQASGARKGAGGL